MKPYTPAAYGLKGLPGPTGRCIHRQASGVLKKLWLKRMAPRPRNVDAFTRGNDLPRNLRNIIQLARCKMSTELFWHKGEGNGNGASLLAQATQIRLTTVVETAWLAAGSFCQPQRAQRSRRRRRADRTRRRTQTRRAQREKQHKGRDVPQRSQLVGHVGHRRTPFFSASSASSLCDLCV